MEIKRYGWRPDLPDKHRPMFAQFHAVSSNNPPSVDLRPHCPPVYDQKDLGSCTANAGGGMVQYLQMREGIPNYVPSRLYIYYNERVLEHSVASDTGASLGDAIKTLATDGAPDEKLWWYDTKKFRVRPNQRVYAEGRKHLLSSYQSLNSTDLNELRTSLATGYPFIMGFTVYKSFESDAVAKTGIVPMPRHHEEILGGHAVMVVGYDDVTRMFTARNSWGSRWGLGGYFLMPYAYITSLDLADDFWTARLIS